MGRLTRLELPGDSEVWETLGFALTEGSFRVGAVELTSGASRPGWAFEELSADPQGLRVPTFEAAAPDGTPPDHPNRVREIDHVVYLARDLDEAIAAIGKVLGLGVPRRARPRGTEGPEMAFFRAGEVILEVVEGGAPALWGVAFATPDLGATVEAVRAAGGPVSDPRPAVQGGRIASVPQGHIPLGVAFYQPPTG